MLKVSFKGFINNIVIFNDLTPNYNDEQFTVIIEKQYLLSNKSLLTD